MLEIKKKKTFPFINCLITLFFTACGSQSSTSVVPSTAKATSVSTVTATTTDSTTTNSTTTTTAEQPIALTISNANNCGNIPNCNLVPRSYPTDTILKVSIKPSNTSGWYPGYQGFQFYTTCISVEVLFSANGLTPNTGTMQQAYINMLSLDGTGTCAQAPNGKANPVVDFSSYLSAGQSKPYQIYLSNIYTNTCGDGLGMPFNNYCYYQNYGYYFTIPWKKLIEARQIPLKISVTINQLG